MLEYLTRIHVDLGALLAEAVAQERLDALAGENGLARASAEVVGEDAWDGEPEAELDEVRVVEVHVVEAEAEAPAGNAHWHGTGDDGEEPGTGKPGS